MGPFASPSELSPDRCRLEVAGILAAGVLRLRKVRSSEGTSAELSPTPSEKSAADRLELSGDTVLSVHSG